MSELQKVYSLPDLPPAPSSDLQSLVRRMVEYADWSALVGIVDELRAYDRNRDLRQLQYIVAGIISNVNGKKPYSVVVHQIIGIFWFDLYDVAGTAEVLSKVEFVAERNKAQEFAQNVGAGQATIQRTETPQQRSLRIMSEVANRPNRGFVTGYQNVPVREEE